MAYLRVDDRVEGGRVKRWILALVLLLCPVIAQAIPQYDALNQCQAAAAEIEASPAWNYAPNGYSWTQRCVFHEWQPGITPPFYYLQSNSNGGEAHQQFNFDAINYPDGTHTCAPPKVPGPNNACAVEEDADEATCQALHDQTSGEGNEGKILVSGNTGDQCIAGCTFGPVGPRAVWTVLGVSSTEADYEYSGGTCSATPQSPGPPSPTPIPEIVKPTAPVCVPAGSGQTYCKRQDGQNCYTPSTGGKAICYSNGETGTKTTGPIAQVRCAGSASCPPPTAPAGETMVPAGPPITVTGTTTNPATGATSTTTTTVNIHSTQYGTDAGESDDGEPTEGGEGEEGEEEEPGTVTGGASCEAPYAVTGGDPVANATLKEIHASKCATEAQIKTEVDALGEIEDEGDGFEGTEADAKASMWSSGAIPSTRYGAGGVSATVFGGDGACPSFPAVEVGGQVWTAPAGFCDAGAFIRWIFVLAAYVGALYWILK